MIRRRVLQINKGDCNGDYTWYDTCVVEEDYDCGNKISEVWQDDASLGYECSDDGTFTKTWYERKYDIYEYGCVVPTDNIRQVQKEYSEDCISDAGGGHYIWKEEIICEGENKYSYKYKYLQLNDNTEYYTGESTKTLLEENSDYCVVTSTEYIRKSTLCVKNDLYELCDKYNVYKDGHRELIERDVIGEILEKDSSLCGSDSDGIWVSDSTICLGHKLYFQETLYEFKDGEFIKTDITRVGDFIEDNSEECGFEVENCGYFKTENSQLHIKIRYEEKGKIGIKNYDKYYPSGIPVEDETLYELISGTYETLEKLNSVEFSVRQDDKLLSLPCLMPGYVIDAVIGVSWTGLNGNPSTNITIQNNNYAKEINLTSVTVVEGDVINYAFHQMKEVERYYGLKEFIKNNFDAVMWRDFEFYQNYKLKTVNLNDPIFYKCNYFDWLFYECNSLVYCNLLHDMVNENTIDINSMFYKCSSLPFIDISGWNTSNVRNMSSLFNGCSSLTQIQGLEKLKFNSINNREYISYMFVDCSSLVNLDLSKWNVQDINLTYIYFQSMFSGCSSLKQVNLPSLDGKYIYLYNMFNGCSSLEEVDLTSFKNSSVNVSYYSTFDSTFYGCTNLRSIKFGDISFKNNGSTTKSLLFDSTFYGCTNLYYVDFSGFKFEDGVYLSFNSSFSFCENLTTVDFSNVHHGGSLYFTFRNCKALKTVLPFEKVEVNNISITRGFYGCSSLETMNLDELFKNREDKNNSTLSLTFAFYDCSLLRDIVFPEVTTITQDSYSFSGCDSLKTLTFIGTNELNVTGSSKSKNVFFADSWKNLDTITLKNCTDSFINTIKTIVDKSNSEYGGTINLIIN